MKKLLALLMCAIIVCSCFMFTACEKTEDEIKDAIEKEETFKTLSGKTPEELYADASELMKNATNFTMTSTQDITMKYQGETMTMTQVIIQKIDGENEYYKMSGVEGADSEGWYVDGVIYTEMNGTKAKATLSKKDYYEKFLGSSEEDSKILNIPESWFKDIVFKKSGDEYYIKFSISGEEYTKLFAKLNLQVGLDDTVDYKVYFNKEGKLLRMETDFDMTVQGISASTKTKSVFSDVGTTAPIVAPTNPESYQDVTDSINSMLG